MIMIQSLMKMNIQKILFQPLMNLTIRMLPSISCVCVCSDLVFVTRVICPGYDIKVHPVLGMTLNCNRLPIVTSLFSWVLNLMILSMLRSSKIFVEKLQSCLMILAWREVPSLVCNKVQVFEECPLIAMRCYGPGQDNKVHPAIDGDRSVFLLFRCYSIPFQFRDESALHFARVRRSCLSPHCILHTDDEQCFNDILNLRLVSWT